MISARPRRTILEWCSGRSKYIKISNISLTLLNVNFIIVQPRGRRANVTRLFQVAAVDSHVHDRCVYFLKSASFYLQSYKSSTNCSNVNVEPRSDKLGVAQCSNEFHKKNIYMYVYIKKKLFLFKFNHRGRARFASEYAVCEKRSV